MSRLSPYICIGRIVKPQGVRGELKIIPETDDPGRFLLLKRVFLRDKDAYSEAEVISSSVRDGFAYISLSSVPDRNAAEALRGQDVFVAREDAVKLPEGRYYICDIIGCRLVTDDGREVGVIDEVIQTGANDVYSAKGEKGEMLIPAIKDAIRRYDVENGFIYINEEWLLGADGDAY